MTSMRRLTATGSALAVLTWALLGVGCGETGDTDPTPVQTFKITPAAAARTASATPSAAATAAATPAPGGEAITLAGIANEFDKEEIEAPAGRVVIEFDNKDGGVVHNLHVFKGDDADGDSVGETELEAGPITQTLTLELEPGDYFYQCDVHPNTMSGTLTVQ